MSSHIISTQGGTAIGIHSSMVYHLKTLVEVIAASPGISYQKSHENFPLCRKLENSYFDSNHLLPPKIAHSVNISLFADKH